MTGTALLDDRAVIALAGPDARPLLQGLITNDMARLTPAGGLYAALLAPQGKILFDFLLAEGDGAVLLDVAAARAEALAKRLTLYKLRAKVSLELRPQLKVMAAWDGSALPGIAFADPRHPELGVRAIAAEAEIPGHLGPASGYLAHRLDLGIPEGEDFGSDAMFALDAGLEELHGVDFKKGCYVGQELTSRMKHRGTARKRLLPVTAGAALPAPGTGVSAGGKSVGEIASTYDRRGFALVRLDRLQEAEGAPLTAGEISLSIERPAWLSA